MTTYNQLEYSNVVAWFDHDSLQEMMSALVQEGLNISWKETQRQFELLVQSSHGSNWLTLAKINGLYRLNKLDDTVKDFRLGMVLYQFIEQTKGHAVVKMVSNQQIVVQNIRYGEAVRIIEIKGAEKKVIYEKACSVTMDQVVAALKRRDAEERIPVLRLELDYELATLYDALKTNDTKQIHQSKVRLKQLRREMLLLEA